MKKTLTTLFALFIGYVIYAQQGLDTIYVRNLSLSYEEWKWLKGGWTPSDSAEKKQWRKLETAVSLASNPNNNTQINVDSLSGKVCLFLFSNYTNATRGETRNFNNDIRTKIRAYTPLTPFCDIIEAAGEAQRVNQIKNGKDDFNKTQ